MHGFVGEKLPSVESTKALVRKIAENFKLPYFTLTPTFSVCPVHGYIAGEHEYCPYCDQEKGYFEGQNYQVEAPTQKLEEVPTPVVQPESPIQTQEAAPAPVVQPESPIQK